MKNELPVPPEVLTDPKATELFRVWAAHGRQHVTLATGLWDDPAAWGIMLVDLAKHAANAYEQRDGMNWDEVMQRIRASFDAEWDAPTDTPKGKLLDEN